MFREKQRSKGEIEAGVPEADSVLLVNCATCEDELLGESQYVWADKLTRWHRQKYPPLCARYKERPYCQGCLQEFKDSEEDGTLVPHTGMPGIPDDMTPDQENAIRAMEDDPGE